MRGLKIIVIISIILQQTFLFAQVSLSITTSSADNQDNVLQKYVGLSNVDDSLSAIKEFYKVVGKLQADGYLLASLDSVFIEEGRIGGLFYVGSQYQYGEFTDLRISGGKRDGLFSRGNPGVFTRSSIESVFQKKLQVANNSGFPFASIKLDSVIINQALISGVVNFDTGHLIKFDTLKINDGPKPRLRYLSAYLKIQPEGPYNEKRVRQIPEYFDQLPYYNLTAPPELLFHNNEARISLEVEKVKSNRFDGIVGILPNSSEDGKLLVTGELNLELLNLFESGKEFKFHWQRLREETQYLDLWLKLPNVLNSPLDLIAVYKQLKEDTTFVNRNARLGMAIRVSPRSDLNFFVDFKSAGLLATDQLQVGLDPENLDFDLTRYGANYHFRTLSPNNIRDEGIELSFEASAGTKKINRNATLDDQVYSGLDLSTALYQFEFDGRYQKEIFRAGFIFHRLRSGLLINDHILMNDMFRVGGFNTLRGFNENFFFANKYLLSNIEFRVPFDRSSYLFLFYDQSFLTTSVTALNGDTKQDYPFGFGLGLQLETASGDFKFAYAVGQSKNTDLSFNQSKIHFGIINRF